MKNIGKPCGGNPHARFEEGWQARAFSLLSPFILFPPPASAGSRDNPTASSTSCRMLSGKCASSIEHAPRDFGRERGVFLKCSLNLRREPTFAAPLQCLDT